MIRLRCALPSAGVFARLDPSSFVITLGVHSLNQSENNIYTGGQPESFADVAAAGVKHVINLRPHAETPDIDESALVADNNMQYHNLPISGAGDLNRENVQHFDELLQQVGAETALVHCASSNRVGALAALRAAWLQGKSTDEAIVIGKRWGMTKIQPVVEGLLRG